mmetsp:Transcript_4692/g.7049  ORF Transcript_4692/g.7049 Transcript_4692/m.7049 type:complete len:260 (+) Transcript_4692:34-813(+)
MGKHSHHDDESPTRRGISYFVCVLSFLAGLAGAIMIWVEYDQKSEQTIQYETAAALLAIVINTLAFWLKEHRLSVFSAGITVMVTPQYASAANSLRLLLDVPLIPKEDIKVALAGIILLLFAIYCSFLSMPGSFRSASKLAMGISFFVSLLSIVSAILYWVPVDDDDVSAVGAGITVVNMAFLFLASVFLQSTPLAMAALFYIGEFYVISLPPALEDGATDEMIAAGSLAFASTLCMLGYYIWASFKEKKNGADYENLP